MWLNKGKRVGLRVGGGAGPVGGSVGQGGVGGRVGPLSWRTSGSGGGPSPVGLLIGIVVVIALIVLVSPLVLVSFSVWVFRRWRLSGRPRYIDMPFGESLLLGAAWVAIPAAIWLGITVWGGMYADATNEMDMPALRGVDLAEARATLEADGFIAGGIVRTAGEAPVADACEVVRPGEDHRSRRGDRRIPVTLEVRCRLPVELRRATVGEARDLLAPYGMNLAAQDDEGQTVPDNCDVTSYEVDRPDDETVPGTVVADTRCPN